MKSSEPFKQCPACSSQPARCKLKVLSQVFNVCARCRTLWLPGGAGFSSYDARYVEERGHDDSSDVVNKAKKRTFKRFWRELGHLIGPVLEVGCSTGIALSVALELGLDAYGLDVNESILQYVEKQGIPVERVSVEGLGKFRGKKFKGVAFFDSFEHIPAPALFFEELLPFLENNAKMVVVLPDSSSFSRRFLGRLWPHYMPDHWVHYSKEGLALLLKKYQIEVVRKFRPVKDVPLEMVLRHITIRCGIGLRQYHRGFPFALRFNIGETGLICSFSGTTELK